MSQRTNCWKCGEPLPKGAASCDCPLPSAGSPEHVAAHEIFGDVLTTQAKYAPIPINFNIAGVIPGTAGAQCLFGWVLTSSASVSGHIRLRDGSTPGSPIVGVGQWGANGESSKWFGDQGINLANGALWLDPLGGSLEGVVYYV